MTMGEQIGFCVLGTAACIAMLTNYRNLRHAYASRAWVWVWAYGSLDALWLGVAMGCLWRLTQT